MDAGTKVILTKSRSLVDNTCSTVGGDVCIAEREREREREGGGGRERKRTIVLESCKFRRFNNSKIENFFGKM